MTAPQTDALIADFLARGGTIKHIPMGESAAGKPDKYDLSFGSSARRAPAFNRARGDHAGRKPSLNFYDGYREGDDISDD